MNESGDADESGPADAAGGLRVDLGLLLVSAAILFHEILETKIFAYSLDSISIYLAISVCLLGLGASATLLAVLPPVPAASVRRVASLLAAAGAACVIVAHLVFARLAGAFAGDRIMESAGFAPETAVALAALMSPYLCFGAVVALLLSAGERAVGRTYAFNLAGSALGCLLVFPVLDAVGAERSLAAVAALALAGAACLAPSGAAARLGLAVGALALVAFYGVAERVIVFPPEPLGQLGIIHGKIDSVLRRTPDADVSIEHLYKKWDRTARVDVYRLHGLSGRPVESLFFVQDSSAGSHLLGTGEDYAAGADFFEKTLYGAAYELGPHRDVLIIGLGGAPDVMTALYHGAEQIDGVDINGAAIDLVRGRFADFLGDPYSRPGVAVHRMDGRTFLRNTDKQYDLIQMTGVDTKAIFASGSLSVNENYMHTQEGFVDLLRHLKPDGVLAINRFSDEALYRVVSTLVAAFEELGVPDPRSHLFAARQGFGWRGIVAKRTPFTDRQVRRLHGWTRLTEMVEIDVAIPAYTWIGLPLAKPVEPLYLPAPRETAVTPFFEALATGELDRYVDSAFLDLSPTFDDRPYFFFYERPLEALRQSLPGAEDSGEQWSAKTLRFLHSLLLQVVTVSAVFMIAPLVVARRRGLRAPGAGRTIAYFLCLGAGFMFAEIGLIQRFVLLLGHQSYAVTVVLLGLLVGASLGSLSSSRLSIASAAPLSFVLVAIAGILGLCALGLGAAFDALAGQPFGLRLAASLAVVVALGVALGAPFPTALRALGGTEVPYVPWAVAVNGFASVIASLLSLEIAMLLGLRALLVLAILLYLLAIPLSPVMWARATGDRAG